MKVNDILSKVSRTGNKALYQIKKHSPEILVVTGAIGTVVGAVMACKATLKVNDILDETRETLDKIHEASEREDLKEEYGEKDAKKDLAIVYTQTAWKFIKLYGPAAIVGGLSLTSIFAGNNILRKRNVALAAAYATVSEGFSEYRKRVVDKFGAEIDKELKYGVKATKIDETVVDAETGKEKTVKKTVGVSDLSEYSDYAVYFDKEHTPYCESNDDYNMMFLRSEQSYANDLLKVKGYLTLNDVLDRLGLKVSDEMRKAGMVVGWKYEENNEIGDNEICFNIFQTYKQRLDGRVEPTIILDFNVDGNIYDRM